MPRQEVADVFGFLSRPYSAGSTGAGKPGMSFAGVVGRRHQSSVGGELISTLEGRDVSYSHQKLCSRKRSHTRQTTHDLRLLTGEKCRLRSSSMLSMHSLIAGTS